MNAGQIWWGQIGNSLKLLTQVTNALRDCHSAVLQVSPKLPWRQVFYGMVDLRRSAFSGGRRLVRLPWTEGMEPGEFVLEELCSRTTRAEYWPGETCGAYLARKDDIVLNDYYVWVTGIHRKEDLSQWMGFLSQYVQHSPEHGQRAVFILEYDGAPTETMGTKKIDYAVEDYDCRVFCLELAAALRNTDLRNYQAELAQCICGIDPELCALLLEAGAPLLSDPVSTVQKVISTAKDPEGRPFAVRTEQQITSAAWHAGIVLMFPVLERYRMDLVSKHEADLASHLPISNSNGDKITDPYDLEIGPISYIIAQSDKNYSRDEVEGIRICRKARNLLAHNKPLPYEEVGKIDQLSRR